MPIYLTGGGGGGGGGTTFNYSSITAPQHFNPDATAVTNETDTYTLVSANAVAFVTINGQVLDDSEYSLVGSDLIVSPDNGFTSTDDEVLVYQHTFAVSGTGGVTTNYVQINSGYTIQDDDHIVEITANTFTVNLPTASGIAGQEYIITNQGAGVVTVDGFNTETINGAATQTLNQYEFIAIRSNGLGWVIVSTNL
jgi:hypothetical protein